MSWIKKLLGGGGSGGNGTPSEIAPPPADSDKFWAIIGNVVDAPMDDRASALAKELSTLEPHELIAFDADYRRALALAYRWDLWAAAYVINGGCSDDGFDYFCDWLISKGRATFEAAVADPASLISAVRTMGDDEDPDFEEFRYVVQEVYEEKTDAMMPILSIPMSGEPKGTPWEEDAVDEMFPSLADWANGRE